MPVLSSDRTYTCIDALRPDEAHLTESAGTVTPGRSGLFTTHNAALAQEFKQRYPWARVVEHEPATGGQATRVLWSLPSDDWKTRPSVVQAHRDARSALTPGQSPAIRPEEEQAYVTRSTDPQPQ